MGLDHFFRRLIEKSRGPGLHAEIFSAPLADHSALHPPAVRFAGCRRGASRCAHPRRPSVRIFGGSSKSDGQWEIAARKYSIRHDWTLISARAYTVDGASRAVRAQSLLHFYHGRARTRYSDKHRLEMLKDRKNFNENPRPSAARPNVPFNSSSASVFSFFFPCFNPTPRRLLPPCTAVSLSPTLSAASLSTSLSLSLSFYPSLALFFHSLRFGPRAVRRAAGHRKYISVEKVKRPPYVRHHSGWTDGRTDGRTNGRARRVVGSRGNQRVDARRTDYLSSCMFIFRAITNEANPNRTKLILLSDRGTGPAVSLARSFHPFPPENTSRLLLTLPGYHGSL